MLSEPAIANRERLSSHSFLPSPSIAGAAVEVVRPHTSKLDSVAARARLREVVTAYVQALRAEGAHINDIVISLNSALRRALSGLVPTRVSDDLRDAVRRWSIAAYDRGD